MLRKRERIFLKDRTFAEPDLKIGFGDSCVLSNNFHKPMKKIKYIYCLSFVLCLSCMGTIEKTWEVTDFSKTHIFSIEVPDNKNVSNVNIYLSGSYTGKILLQEAPGYPVMEFEKDSLPERLFFDFYGGRYDISLLPSNAEGKLVIKIQIPYGP